MISTGIQVVLSSTYYIENSKFSNGIGIICCKIDIGSYTRENINFN